MLDTYIWSGWKTIVIQKTCLGSFITVNEKLPLNSETNKNGDYVIIDDYPMLVINKESSEISRYTVNILERLNSKYALEMPECKLIY